MADMRKKLRKQMRRARDLYEEGQKHMEAGAVMKAASALTMAATFDPKNKEYVQAAADAQLAARKIQAKNFVQLAESAESFANLREALANYQKAVEYQVEEARPYYRLGVLLRRIEEDHRAALEHFRTAVKMAPEKPGVPARARRAVRGSRPEGQRTGAVSSECSRSTRATKRRKRHSRRCSSCLRFRVPLPEVGSLAQSVEHRPFKPMVAGSSPARPPFFLSPFRRRVAQPGLRKTRFLVATKRSLD